MELRIEKFAELQNRTLTTPCAVIGKNGAGKTTMMNAYLWCLTGKGKDGSEMADAVYSTKDKLADKYAAVEVKLCDMTFRRVCQPKFHRASGETDKSLKSLCTTTYYVNGVEVKMTDYDREVAKICKGKPFQLFSDINYFSSLKKDQQLAIFMEMLGINREDYFGEMRSSAEISSEIREVKKTIKDRTTWLEGEKQNLQKIAIPTDYSAQIDEIKAEIEDLQSQRPRLTKEQIEENNAINQEISKLDIEIKQGFILSHRAKDAYDEAKKAYFGKLDERNELVRRRMAEEEMLKHNKENLAGLEENCEFDENKGEFATIMSRVDYLSAEKKKNAKIVEKYDEMIKEARCTICAHCEDIFCENKVTNLKEKSQYIAEIEQISNEIADLKSKSYQLKEDWEIEMNEKISFMKGEIEKNKANLTDFDKKIGEIDKQMAEMVESSAELEEAMKNEVAEDNQKKAEFDKKISQNQAKISELKAKMHIAVASATDNKIWSLKVKLSELEKKQNATIETNGHRKGLADSISRCEKVLSDLTVQLADLERELMRYERADEKYRQDIMDKANQVLPEGMSVTLFRPLITGTGYENVFELTYDAKKYKNTALLMVGNLELTDVFQRGFGVDLPIFVDDIANIVNDDLIKRIVEKHNIVMLLAGKNMNLEVFEGNEFQGIIGTL